MAKTDLSARPPLTDSPWFWTYLFATAGLVALFLMGPKYDVRQAQLEREYSARQSHGFTTTGEDGPIRPPKKGQQRIRLAPFYWILGGILVIAWTGLWIKRYSSTQNGGTSYR